MLKKFIHRGCFSPVVLRCHHAPEQYEKKSRDAIFDSPGESMLCPVLGSTSFCMGHDTFKTCKTQASHIRRKIQASTLRSNPRPWPQGIIVIVQMLQNK